MVKEIEIYKGKNITVDFDKVNEYICKWFALFLFVIYVFLKDGDIGIGVPPEKNIILMMVTLFTFITFMAANILKGEFKLNSYMVLLLVYLALIILSAINSIYPENVLFATVGRYEGVFTLASYLACFYFFYKGFKHSKIIFILMTISVVILSLYGVVQVFLTDTKYFAGKHPYMAYSNFTNPNMFSSYLSIFLPIYLVKYYTHTKKHNIFLYVCIALFAALVCAKTSWGYVTFILYFATLALYYITKGKNKKDMIVRLVIIGTCFLIIFILLNLCFSNSFLKELMDNFKTIKEVKDKESALKLGNNRLYIWKLCLEVVKHYPIFGVGPDCLGKEVLANYYGKDGYAFSDPFDKAHNEYLHIAVTTGVPSLCIYISFVLLILIRMRKKYKNNIKSGDIYNEKSIQFIAVSISVLSYLFQAIGNISIFQVAPLFWAMLGICAKISEKEY